MRDSRSTLGIKVGAIVLALTFALVSAPVGALASGETIDGTVQLGSLQANCDASLGCAPFVTGRGCNPSAIDDRNPWGNVRSIIGLTKERVRSASLTVSSSQGIPEAPAHYVVLSMWNSFCREADNDPGDHVYPMHVGESAELKLPRGAAWLVVYTVNGVPPNLESNTKWSLTLTD